MSLTPRFFERALQSYLWDESKHAFAEDVTFCGIRSQGLGGESDNIRY